MTVHEGDTPEKGEKSGDWGVGAGAGVVVRGNIAARVCDPPPVPPPAPHANRTQTKGNLLYEGWEGQ